MKTSSCCVDWSICFLQCVKSPYLKSWCHYCLHYMIALLSYLLVVKNIEPQTRTYYVKLWDMHVAMRTLGRYLISLKSKFKTKACATHPADFANRSRWSWVPINVLVCQVANPLRFADQDKLKQSPKVWYYLLYNLNQNCTFCDSYSKVYHKSSWNNI